MDVEDGNIKVIDSYKNEIKTYKGNVSNSNIRYIKNIFETTINGNEIINHETVINDMNQVMSSNPGRSNYKVNYENGSWAEVNITLEKVDSIDNNQVNTYFSNAKFPNEKEIGSEEWYLEDGTYNYEYELKEYMGVYYAKNLISVNFTVSDNNACVIINSCHTGQSAGGIITVANASKNVNVNSCKRNQNPTLWCEANNQVVFNVSGSVGLNLTGDLSISVTAGQSWTQYAIIRISLVAAHSYAAYYI